MSTIPDRYLTRLCSISVLTIAVFLSNAGYSSELSQIQKKSNLMMSFDCSKPVKIPLPDSYKQIELKQSWCGHIPKELRSAAPAKRYIDRQSEWLKLWKTYRRNEAIPKVNFDRELIVLYVHSDANDLSISPVLSRTGDFSLAVSFTEQGMGDTPCSYVLAVVNRSGIKTIGGKPIGSTSSKDFVF
jgi:hypothetical protein